MKLAAIFAAAFYLCACSSPVSLMNLGPSKANVGDRLRPAPSDDRITVAFAISSPDTLQIFMDPGPTTCIKSVVPDKFFMRAGDKVEVDIVADIEGQCSTERREVHFSVEMDRARTDPWYGDLSLVSKPDLHTWEADLRSGDPRDFFRVDPDIAKGPLAIHDHEHIEFR